jgi:hypothetical protein
VFVEIAAAVPVKTGLSTIPDGVKLLIESVGAETVPVKVSGVPMNNGASATVGPLLTSPPSRNHAVVASGTVTLVSVPSAFSRLTVEPSQS